MNISDTIEPKVDQLTADHLIGQTKTIRISAVHLSASEQPCELRYDGDNGLPYRPGKSMRRVLVHAWGGDVNTYAGRSLRLYRDDDVQFGGLKVGGIRISHMSHITSALTLALTAKKGSKKAFKVLPLVDEPPAEPPVDKAAVGVGLLVDRIKACASLHMLAEIDADPEITKRRAWLTEKRPELADKVTAAMAEKRAALDEAPTASEDDGWPGPGGSAAA